MNILVTGACGFIGSHLVEKLVKENHNVRAFTFYNSMNSYGWLNNVDKKLLKDLKPKKIILGFYAMMIIILVTCAIIITIN